MTSRISNPLPFFLDRRGLPMDGGKLYVGVVNLDPETNPASVFLDEALTQPATQPIQIIGGAPCADGNPSFFYVAADTYSIRVRDRDGSEVFFVGKAEGEDGTNGNDGAPAVTAFLTNDPIQLPAASDGTVTSYSGATGSFRVFQGSTNVSANFALSTLNNPQALTVGYTTQNYTITGGFDAGETTASLTIRATGTGAFAGVILDKTVTLTKAITGPTGASAVNNAVAQIYKRSATTPALPSATATYTFATGALSGLNNGWTQTIPAADGNPLYVSAASASATGTTDTIAAGEWAAPVILVQDGSAGLNNAVVNLYQRAASSPAAPSGTFTYTFATGVLSGGTPNGWTTAVPAADGNPLWVIAATASASTATDTIAAAEFSSPVIDTGAGLNTETVRLYQRSATTPSVPGSTLTYTFATGVLSGTLGSWTQTIPAGSNPLYTIQATALSTGTTDTITTGEWSSPVVMAQDGANGLNTATVFLFKRTATNSAPPVPTTTSTYTFATGVLTGQDNGWTQSVPAAGGNAYLWSTTATALGTGLTDTIPTGEWATPNLVAQDGAAGQAAVILSVTRPAVVLFTYADGTVVTFANANGLLTLKLADGTDVTAAASLSATASGCTGTINTALNTPVSGQPKGYYQVTAMSGDEATLTLTAVYNTVTYTTVISLTKSKAGYEIVGTLPATNLFEGRTVFLNTDGKLYRYHSGSWTRAVDGADLMANTVTTNAIFAGAITAATLAASNVVTLTAQISDGIISNAKIIDGTIQTAKIADAQITTAKIADANVTTAKIADANITTAKIQDLNVTTIKIGANQVTVPLVISAPGSVVGNGSYQTILSGSMTLAYAGVIFMLVTAKHSYTAPLPQTWSLRAKINGTVVGDAGGGGGYTDAPSTSGSGSVSAGTHSVAADWQAGSGITISSVSGFAQGAMR